MRNPVAILALLTAAAIGVGFLGAHGHEWPGFHALVGLGTGFAAGAAALIARPLLCAKEEDDDDG